MWTFLFAFFDFGFEMNHSPRFWQTVESIFPEFREARQTLKHHPPELLPAL